MKAPSSQKNLQIDQLCLQWITDEGWTALFSKIHGVRSSRCKHLLDFLIFSWGEKGRKLMNVSAMLSWKEQEIWCPSLANLRLIETMSISVDSPHQMVCLHLPFFSLTVKLHSGCSYQGFPWKHLPLHHSPLEECLYDLLFEIDSKHKGSWKRRKGNLHTQWNDLISHDSFKAFSKFSSYFFGGLEVNFIHCLSQ